MASIHNTVISAHYARILTVMHLDLSRSLTIVDPFDFDTSRSSNTRNNGALLNCFSEKYLEWLPSPNINDVIILRGAKVRLIDLPCTTHSSYAKLCPDTLSSSRARLMVNCVLLATKTIFSGPSTIDTYKASTMGTEVWHRMLKLWEMDWEDHSRRYTKLWGLRK